MNRIRAFVPTGLLIALTCACASTADRSRPAPPPGQEPGAASEGSAPAARRPATPELEIWNEPAFRRRFAESYVAETEIEPRLTVVERERMQEALDLMASDKLDKAVALLERHRGEAHSAVFDFTLANIRFQEEELERAAAAYQAAVDKHPKFRRAWQNLGLIHVRQEDFERAVPALTRVLELGGGDAVTYGLLGFAYSHLDQNLSAESAYRMANLLDPHTMDWKTGLARSFFRQKRYAEAAALCDSLISGRPDSADLWLLQANAFIGLGQPLRAAENFELVDRLGKSTAASLENLGDIYVNQELFDLGVTCYLRAMERSPEATVERPLRAAKALASRGAVRETRRLVVGIESLRGDRLEPGERKDLLGLRARLAVAEGAGEEEVRVLEEMIELDPLDGEALILLGDHSRRAGEPEQALFYYERAASLEAFEADAKVRHAQLLVEQGKYAEALPLLRRAQTLEPRENVQVYLEQVERVGQGR